MSVLLALIPVLSAAPLARTEGQILSTPRNAPSVGALGGTPLGAPEGDGTFVRSLGCGVLGSVGGGFLGYWAARGSNGGMEPGTGALVGTASGMVLGSALGAWSKRDAGARYSNPLPPVLGAAVGGSLGVGVWGLAGLVSGNGSEPMDWESLLLLISAPWIGSALGAGVEQAFVRETAAITPWIPETGGAGLQVSLRY